MLGYSFFIIAFALGFYILLHKSRPDPNLSFFDDPYLSIVKTFTMFVGEIGDLQVSDNLQPTKALLVNESRYIYFLVFVFLIVIVMMNLLNGLAVSDINKLREEAEIWATKSDVEIIYALVSSTINDMHIRITLTIE